jgi:hypothetical protein
MQEHAPTDRGRRCDDAEQFAHALVDQGEWEGPIARWHVLAEEALTVDLRRAWRQAGAPRRRTTDGPARS